MTRKLFQDKPINFDFNSEVVELGTDNELIKSVNIKDW
jgi:hypothetical protein